MRYRPINSEPEDQRLDRLIPDDWRHVERWPLMATQIPEAPVPVVLGINWYAAFDDPELVGGRYWIGRGNLGRIRGGHAICAQPGGLADTVGWYRFYNQIRQGACGGMAGSRMMSLLNRRRYNPWWLWDRAKERDEWADTNPGDNNGTSVRAVMDVLRDLGHTPDKQTTPRLQEGIAANRWASTVEQVHEALKNPEADRLEAVPLLNSWGDAYPRKVWLPDKALHRVLGEYGEATIVTDRR